MDWNQWSVVVASSKLERRNHVAGMLFRLGIDPLCIASVDQCRELPLSELALVFCDYELKDGDFRDVVSAIGSPDGRWAGPRVVVMVDSLTPEQYRDVRQNGVFDVIPSLCRPMDVEWMLILAKRNLQMNERPSRLFTPSVSVLCKAAGAGS